MCNTIDDILTKVDTHCKQMLETFGLVPIAGAMIAVFRSVVQISLKLYFNVYELKKT